MTLKANCDLEKKKKAYEETKQEPLDPVRYVISKVGKRVGVLGRLRRNITIHAAFEMYNSLILPIFDYCDVVWSSCNKADMESLESLQRRASKNYFRFSEEVFK